MQNSVVVLKKGYHLLINPFQWYFFSEWLVYVCAFCSFTTFLSIFFVFHRKNLVLLNWVYKYVTSKVSNFWKAKTLCNFVKWFFGISWLFIQWNTNSCSEHIMGGANIYLYVFVSLFVGPCVWWVSLWVCVCA